MNYILNGSFAALNFLIGYLFLREKKLKEDEKILNTIRQVIFINDHLPLNFNLQDKYSISLVCTAFNEDLHEELEKVNLLYIEIADQVSKVIFRSTCLSTKCTGPKFRYVNHGLKFNFYDGKQEIEFFIKKIKTLFSNSNHHDLDILIRQFPVSLKICKLESLTQAKQDLLQFISKKISQKLEIKARKSINKPFIMSLNDHYCRSTCVHSLVATYSKVTNWTQLSAAHQRQYLNKTQIYLSEKGEWEYRSSEDFKELLKEKRYLGNLL